MTYRYGDIQLLLLCFCWKGDSRKDNGRRSITTLNGERIPHKAVCGNTAVERVGVGGVSPYPLTPDSRIRVTV